MSKSEVKKKIKVQPLSHKGTKELYFKALSKGEEKSCRYGIYCAFRIIFSSFAPLIYSEALIPEELIHI